MSNSDQLLPNEDETQSLNKMAAEIKSLDYRLETVENKVDAQSRRTNADLLSAFSRILKEALEQQKAELRAEIKEALEQQKVELRAEIKEALEQQKVELRVEIKEALEQQKAELRAEIKEALEQQKVELRVEFAEMLRAGLEKQKAELRAEIREMMDQLSIKLREEQTEALKIALTEQKAELVEILNRKLKPIRSKLDLISEDLNSFKTQTAEQLKAIRFDVKDVWRHYHMMNKDISDRILRVEDLEDKMEKIETKLVKLA
ncbi:MAG: hypothetical protein HY819_22155 [Acidobacteria bacterium]|nr:hypothetical protein [Acidobacteriota bacterium]